MSRKVYYIIFILLIALGLTGFVLIKLDFFPVVIINSRLVSEAQFELKVKKVTLLRVSSNEPLDDYELKRLALEKLIEEELVYQGAEKYGKKDARKNGEIESLQTFLALQLKQDGEVFEEWLRLAKRSARVIILASDFLWDGSTVLYRK